MAGNFTININTQTLRTTANTIEGINKDLDGKLSDIKTKMNNLRADWESAAADEIIKKMNAMQERFDLYKSIVEDYKTFLINTAQSYESTESALKSNAEMFQ